LPPVSGGRRLLFAHWELFRPKLVAHADSQRFADTGIYPHAQSHAHNNSEGSDTNYSQPDAKPHVNSHTDTDAYAFAWRFSRSWRYCYTNSKLYLAAFISVA
jgi:hypothetical protein